MLKKSVLAVFCLLLLGPAWSAFAKYDPALAVYWPLDEGTGTVANDMSGNGINGTISAGPTWVTVGKIGGAINFTGTGDIRGAHVAIDSRSFTIAMWVNPRLPASGSGIVFSEQSSGANSVSLHLRIGGPASTDSPVSGIRFGFYNDDVDSPANVLQSNTWYHLTFRYDAPSKNQRIYVNGVQVAMRTATNHFLATTGVICLGSWTGGSNYTGMVDDFQLYQKALSDAEIKNIMAGLSNKSLAVNVSPVDGATDVPRDATLNWTAGQYPATHDVYLGTTAADVNNASRTNKGLLVSQGQADTTFDPAAVFAYGQTYFWRIDEVNTSADATVYKGAVWSFTAEPYGYPITGVTATASSSAASMGPEKTVDGSGMTGDLAGTDGTTMWMSGGVKPNWIQYQFDKVYKLFDMKVWNSNQLIESFLGFGAKNVTIETSTDGTTWTALANAPEFAKATGMAGYAANTTVNMGGVMAKYVKLTINSNWGGMAPQTGLSEVRFSQIPVQARAPQPANAATGVKIDTTLNWRPGREAGSHSVYFGTDQAAVANGTVAAKTVADHSFAPGSPNFGTTYYWRVDEVNTVTYPGDVWSFTTQEYSAVDNFESYNDTDARIYDTWVDGWTNGSGSVVGYLQAPFAEQTVIHGGKQSMPLEYNNVKTPFYSEASRTFDTNQNWTTSGADTLSLWFRGYGAGFVDKGNNAYTISASGTDIWNNGDQFRFVYKSLSGNGSLTMRVDSIGNTNTWAKAGPMIRETLDANAKNAFIGVTPGQGVSFQWRNALAGASANSQTAALVAPYWVRITRTGNVFKAERSADGKTWTQQGVDTTVSMTANVFIGMAVTSHDAALTTVAEISNVSASGTITGQWQAVAIGATMRTNDPAPLYLTVEDKAGKKKTVVNANAAATTVSAWTEWRIPLSDLTGVSLTTVKKITVGVGDQASPKAGGAGMLFIDDIGFGHPVQ